jgi:hypothetical protein
VGPSRDSERYAADYGNLLLEVTLCTKGQERVFDYRVTDKTDGFVCWTGSAPNLDIAQSDAILEAQLFLDPYITSPPAPRWRRDTEPGAHI